MFHQDNPRPHTTRITLQKIKELGWEKIPHSPQSHDSTSLNYNLFRSLQNHLGETAFVTQKDLKTDISEFFESNSKEFYNGGINNFVNRLKKRKVY